MGPISGFFLAKSTYHTLPVNAQPSVIMEVVDSSLEPYAPMWQAEIGRRFNNAVGVLVHGGDFEEGRWIVGAHLASHRHVMLTADLVRHYQALYPTRTIVLLACNTGHLNLGIPGVYYSKASVWCIPDRALTPEMLKNGIANRTFDDEDVPERESSSPQQSRWQSDPEVTGNIYEFVSE